MKRNIYSEEVNFVTLTVVSWIDVFTRRLYGDFVIESLNHCRQKKALKIFAYVIMSNHLHMVVKAEDNNLPSVLRDFKTYTSKEMVKMIKANHQESRRSWMLKSFANHGAANLQNKYNQFWQNGNYPVALYSEAVTNQKINYIHQNPVRAGFVDRPEHYHYSSANPYSPLKIDQ